jgi:hypothetical protein
MAFGSIAATAAEQARLVQTQYLQTQSHALQTVHSFHSGINNDDKAMFATNIRDTWR